MPLLAPLQLGSLHLPNRVVLAPLTRRRAGAGKIPTELNALHYEQRAGAGLIITESTEIDPASDETPPTRPGLYNAAQADGWKSVVERVHRAGGRIFVQLSHLGRAGHPLLLRDGGQPLAPSAIPAEGTVFTREGPKPFVVPRALETDEIARLVQQFAHAASLARQAGFDGIELHGANGYLIDEFLRDGTNRRSDRYGGSVENRLRFLIEIIEAVSSMWDLGRVGVRLSPFNSYNGMSDSDPYEHFRAIAAALGRLGLAYLHLIEPAPGTEEAPARPLAPGLARLFNGPVIVAGGYDQHSGERAIRAGDADLVAFGQLYIANPDLPERFRTHAGLNTPDRSTYYGGGEKGYTDYPALQTI